MNIRRALDYPYELSKTSFILNDGVKMDWETGVDLSDRIPVLACGSNQSPVQLKRKFPTGCVPVMAGWLSDYDSVYSAHFTTYGSVAATYHYEVGLRTRQMVTWLDADQLDAMHNSEALGVNYEFVEFDGLDFQSDCDQVITTAHSYQSLRGPLKLAGKPVGLSAIKAEGRSYQALWEEELQNRLLDIFDYQAGLENFIQETINDKEKRLSRTARLVALSSE
ncbi:hypothetical protein RYZ26_00315 [Terasakiella sp. A23]|uniref:hypothetical protein n=1 Tax=Terasakiella sp. FCG-A23 TaxID=3080561 RepID=UPI00295568C4|nr:hypothetical protein [Terasakiella sp. A23]MDV7338016.1 hypothetical protein [Terasakiella sp. A23]